VSAELFLQAFSVAYMYIAPRIFQSGQFPLIALSTKLLSNYSEVLRLIVAY